ncbi:hypothetical protein [Microbulbifer sp. PSTR4-B]|uniref:hypothetical protein n=1 Tax=Microbulbifer sp. PSTR4-B TaxID=3243396 RepID=UPI00403A6A67
MVQQPLKLESGPTTQAADSKAVVNAVTVLVCQMGLFRDLVDCDLGERFAADLFPALQDFALWIVWPR